MGERSDDFLNYIKDIDSRIKEIESQSILIAKDIRQLRYLRILKKQTEFLLNYDYEKALECNIEATAILEYPDDVQSIFTCYGLRTMIYENLHNINEALKTANATFAYAMTMQDEEAFNMIIPNLARLMNEGYKHQPFLMYNGGFPMLERYRFDKRTLDKNIQDAYGYLYAVWIFVESGSHFQFLDSHISMAITKFTKEKFPEGIADSFLIQGYKTAYSGIIDIDKATRQINYAIDRYKELIFPLKLNFASRLLTAVKQGKTFPFSLMYAKHVLS